MRRLDPSKQFFQSQTSSGPGSNQELVIAVMGPSKESVPCNARVLGNYRVTVVVCRILTRRALRELSRSELIQKDHLITVTETSSRRSTLDLKGTFHFSDTPVYIGYNNVRQLQGTVSGKQVAA